MKASSGSFWPVLPELMTGAPSLHGVLQHETACQGRMRSIVGNVIAWEATALHDGCSDQTLAADGMALLSVHLHEWAA